ncbi:MULTISPECIES: hypothetical protein [unclassified Micromonospora]|uniref:hypothetical protein n=1 Tax=unclassified Micromonospora TaxID=2617518 RepID=UPI00362B8FCF
MRHRDWGRGEGSPREWQPSLPWDASGDQPPADSHSSAVERYRTPSRRRAARRGQQEPVETYLPRWALDSGVERADGGGRHAARDDDDDVRPHSGAGWRTTETTTSWRRVSETTWRDVPAIEAAPEREQPGGWRDVPAIEAAPEPERSGGWWDEASRDEGYVGSRRADEDEPVSGAARAARPRRSSSRRPQVVWSGLEDVGTATGAAGADAAESGGRRTRRSRRAGADSWSTRPAVDPWERGAADTPEATAEVASYQPAVDPWDASGVHAWDRSTVESRWESPDGAARWDQTGEIGEIGRWDRTGEVGRWEEPGDAGRWDHTGEIGRWDRAEEVGRWERAGEAGSRERSTTETGQRDRVDDGRRWDRAAEPRSGDGSIEGWSWPEHVEGFWSGTRLAGDDPRWMDAPASAPRSPVVPYTAPRPRSAPRRRAEPARRRGEPVGGARAVGVPSRRRAESTPASRSWNRRLEDDLLDPDPGGPFRPLVYTAACYLLPAVLVFVWLLTLDGQAPAGCVTDISGGGCDSPRSHALGSLVDGAPRFGLALASSLVVALLLRRVGTTWRSATVALAAAVVGGGLSTVMISAVTGQPIG